MAYHYGVLNLLQREISKPNGYPSAEADGHLKTLAYATPVDSVEDLVARIAVAAAPVHEISGNFESELSENNASRSIDIVKQVSLLVGEILNS
ncbi:hypothetical protein AVEN_109908-1 [Araneus ventricosus]|uniref:Uncharacterized protein n=1 Tax=Araneus ventricosus TaxID=182803 RepID=A0A4Y2GRN7_ARAVE|nr:hypothetical protein AVEN_109908-1 [Araneus ventricosus]